VGIGIAEVREQTGYDDKKLRNIIFRLNKMEKIQRVSRGSYKAVE
jgi:predicted transcriptional regulator of viral defense system